MPSWNSIFDSVQQINALESKKQSYFKSLIKHTKRNTIVYFSCWQQKNNQPGNYAIDDDDRNGFMNAIHKLDSRKGLDLIIHTPGGDGAATQSIVNYVLKFFNGDLRVIVPHTAMSAGTMIACAAKEIVMGKQSNLGPIDPQINGVPANEYIKMYKNGLSELTSGQNVQYWKDTLAKYPPFFIGMCQNAIASSKLIVKGWLSKGMLNGNPQNDIDDTIEYLSDANTHLLHNNRLDIDVLNLKTKLKITPLEADSKLQDLVLSLYHCYQILSGSTSMSKIIENHLGVKFIKQNGK